MKKIIVALMSFMLIFGSVSYANGLAKQDAELLFGTQKITKVQAVTLDKSEMAKTEGKWLGFVLRWGWTAARVYWKTWRTGGRIYSRGWHGPHHNFGTRKRSSWRKHYQWNTSHGTYRVPYGKHYLYKNRMDLGYRSWWRR